MRVVVSVGGSVLAPDLDPERVTAYAAAIGDLLAAGHEVGAVVGGGTVARDYIGAARDLGANEIELDELGIGVTRLNARLLIAALGRESAPSPAETYEEAGEAMRRGDVAVMGGVVAGQTTDAVSAALAEYVDADLLVYATSVSGVYSADPRVDPDAERFAELTAAELVDVVADLEMRAGSSAPVDLLAAKLIQRSGVRAIVVDGTDPSVVADAVFADAVDGTEIRPGD
jgi:uridylate kinase